MTFADLATQVRTCYNSLQQLVNTLSDGFANIEGGGGGGSSSYSTEERVIGTWIDGKPLYQKTWSNLTVSVVTAGWNDTGISAVDIDTIVDGTMQDENKQKIDGTIGFMLSRTHVGVYPQIIDRTITTLTIQYTKTTD